MKNADDESRKKSEEVSVTDVSDSVLEELSGIFGTKHPMPDAVANLDITEVVKIVETIETTETIETVEITQVIETVEMIETIETPGEKDDSHSFSDFESSGIVFADSTKPLTIPVDPLLPMPTDAGVVINIFDDNEGAVVINADEMDRVVIVDDDRPDPTFEERRRRRERRERLKRVRWFKLAGVVVGVVVFVMAVLASPLFGIRQITFEGTVYTSPATLSTVRASLKGTSIFTVDTARARAFLLEDPWVGEVRITTDFPGRALVEISERIPVIWYVGDDQKARVIDARGHVIEVLAGWPTKYLQVQGVGASLEAGAIADDVYRAAAQIVLALPEEIRPRVKSLDLSAGGELSMILKGNTIVRFGPPTDLQNKLVAVVVLLRRQDPATLAVVDVSTGEPSVQTR